MDRGGGWLGGSLVLWMRVGMRDKIIREWV